MKILHDVAEKLRAKLLEIWLYIVGRTRCHLLSLVVDLKIPVEPLSICARKRGLNEVAFKLFKFVLHWRILFIICALNQAEQFIIIMFRLAVHTTVVILKTYTAPDC